MPLSDFRCVHLPYCLQRMEDGRYVVLNREYKPLGFQTYDFINYRDFPMAVRFKRLTPRVAAKLSSRGSANLDRIFLYHDGCIPTDSPAKMRLYLNRIAILAR